MVNNILEICVCLKDWLDPEDRNEQMILKFKTHWMMIEDRGQKTFTYMDVIYVYFLIFNFESHSKLVRF